MLKHKYSDKMLECGIDEAGRGCLSGPVTAAAVILKPGFTHKEIAQKLGLKSYNEVEKILSWGKSYFRESELLEFIFIVFGYIR